MIFGDYYTLLPSAPAVRLRSVRDPLCARTFRLLTLFNLLQ